jgi:hypothetical protein
MDPQHKRFWSAYRVRLSGAGKLADESVATLRAK